MTEIPEHLLARSKARRAAMGGGDGGDATPAPAEAAAAPAAQEASAPAAAAASAAPVEQVQKAEPVPPWVQAAQQRRKIPYWAAPVLVLTLVWAAVYALTLDEPTSGEPSPLDNGASVYATCAGCHGATGQGVGATPALSGDNSVVDNFVNPVDQVTWVALGTSGYQALGLTEMYPGHNLNPSAVMPGWIDSLSGQDLMDVVLHERMGLNAEEFDPAVWDEGWEEGIAKLPEDKAAELTAILEAWKADPPQS